MKKYLLVAMAVVLQIGVLVPSAEAHNAGQHNRFAGWFTFCGYDRSAYVDPIVNRGGRSEHRHDFFGGNVTATSTESQLRSDPTTCTFDSNSASPCDSGDHSGYWSPSMKLSTTGEWIKPLGMHVYPRTAVGIENHDVSSWEPGTEAVFRDNEIGSKYAGADVRWYCADEFPGQGNNGDKRQRPYFCGDPDYPYVALEMITPGCMKFDVSRWPDKFSHSAYSDAQAGCPSTHGKEVPEMRLVIKYDSRNGQNFVMEHGMDPGRDIHIDFFAAWNSSALEYLIKNCIRDSNVCGNDGRPN